MLSHLLTDSPPHSSLLLAAGVRRSSGICTAPTAITHWLMVLASFTRCWGSRPGSPTTVWAIAPSLSSRLMLHWTCVAACVVEGAGRAWECYIGRQDPNLLTAQHTKLVNQAQCMGPACWGEGAGAEQRLIAQVALHDAIGGR